MFLNKLIILNNKSCRKIVLSPSKTEPEVLIGINDCGKTTTLKSLDVFFDEKKSISFNRVDSQKGDLSNTPLKKEEINTFFVTNGYPSFFNYSNDIVIILCEFELEVADLKDEEFINSAKNLQLKWSVEDLKKLVIMRVFNNNVAGTPDYSGYYLLARDYKDGEDYLELWKKGKTEFKPIKEKFSVSEDDVKNENGKGPFANMENLMAIYKKLEDKLSMDWFRYDSFSKDKPSFPEYKYLDWNFSLKDLEDMAKEAMINVTDPLLLEIKKLAETKQFEAKIKVDEEFEKIMGNLKDELPKNIKNISSAVCFKVNQEITDIKLQKENIDGEVHIDNQGDGIKRQIWFALLKWRSKIKAGEGKRNRYIWCFDEPETHLYPLAQRQLFSTFKDMCANEFQVLLSTHSTVFVDRTKIADVNQVVLNNGYTKINQSDSTDDLFVCLGIKNSDFLFFDKFLAVEGSTEYELIPSLYKLKFGKTLSEDGVQLINLKGKDQAPNNKLILENLLSGFQKTDNRVFYLFDSDTGITGNNVFNIGTYDLEDAISNNIWIDFVRVNCEINLTEQILNNEIRNNLVNTNQGKFHKLLTNYVNQNLVNGKYLPSKGCDLGRLLAVQINSVEKIPEKIIEVFNAINS